MVSPITGSRYSADDDHTEKDLKAKVDTGHSYWVVDGSITYDEAKVIVIWNNRDQDTNLSNEAVPFTCKLG